MTEAQLDALFADVAVLIGAEPPKPPKVADATIVSVATGPAVIAITGLMGGVNPNALTRVSTAGEQAYANAALCDEYQKLAAKLPGSSRNQALNDAALHMGEMVAAGWIEQKAVGDALWEASGSMVTVPRMVTRLPAPRCNRVSAPA